MRMELTDLQTRFKLVSNRNASVKPFFANTKLAAIDSNREPVLCELPTSSYAFPKSNADAALGLEEY